jgi:predicted phage-related endonuclease
MVHPKYDFITGTIDRLIVGENALLEIKTTDKMMTSKWADGVPAYIMPQVQHYLLFDYKYVDVAVLFGGNEAKVYRVHPDKELQEIMVDQYKYFWHCVQNRITPEPVTIGDMQKFYKDQGTTVIADTDIMQAYNEFELLKQQIKELEKIQDEYKAKICSYMGENQVLITVDGKKLVTWKEQITKRLDTKLLKEENSELYEKYLKESKSRVLRG